MELPLLQGAGSVSHKTAQTIADQQYTQFAEERRLTAQQKADKRYIDDLRQAAALLERQQNRKPDDE